MKKALREIGWRKAFKFFFFTLFDLIYRGALFPPPRLFLLRIAGARIGSETILHSTRFFNLYRTGFRGLQIGSACFIGDDCLLDLADRIVMEDQVTLAERVTVLTHINVGYDDHPLQRYLPSRAAAVTIRRGAFIGACATLLPGIEIGQCAVVAAGAVVNESVAPYSVVGGVPARVIREHV